MNTSSNNTENTRCTKISTQTAKKYIVIMAGGSGTRMQSDVPKQLMKIGNVPMMVHLLNNAVYMQAPVILVVSAKNKDMILKILLDDQYIEQTQDPYKYICRSTACGYNDIDVWICVQQVANGTGGALIATSEFLKSVDPKDSVLVLSADVPLITKKTMNIMFDKISNSQSHCCILAKNTAHNFGYGRIDTDADGKFIKIIEQKDCSDSEKDITLINNGVYTFKIGSLLSVLPHLKPNNAQNEYYLTDCPKLIKDMVSNESSSLNDVKIHVIDNDAMYDETLGANTPEQLEELRCEYTKKFTIELIDSSDINVSDYNLQNLMRILDQLSSSKSTTKIEDMNIDKIRSHIQNMNESKINKKHLMVIKYEDIVVGTGSVLIEDKLIHDMGRAGHIEDVVVDEAYRNLGLVKMLMRHLITFAKDHGCYKVILDASDTVKGFYEKFGFQRHANSMRLDLIL